MFSSSNLLAKSLSLFLTYLMIYIINHIPSSMPITLMAFLIESNLVGSMPSEETTNALLLTKGLKSNLAFRCLKCIILPSFKLFAFHELVELFMTVWFQIVHFRCGIEIPMTFKWFQRYSWLKLPSAHMPVYS